MEQTRLLISSLLLQSRTTSQDVIEKMNKIFSRLGIPLKVVLCRATVYSMQSRIFPRLPSSTTFATSNPKYPQSNELAAKSVQTAKRITAKLMGNTLIYDF